MPRSRCSHGRYTPRVPHGDPKESLESPMGLSRQEWRVSVGKLETHKQALLLTTTLILSMHFLLSV